MGQKCQKLSRTFKNPYLAIFEGKNIHESQLFSSLLGYQGFDSHRYVVQCPSWNYWDDSWFVSSDCPVEFNAVETPYVSIFGTPIHPFRVVPGSFCVSWEENHLGRSFEPQFCEFVAAKMFNQSLNPSEAAEVKRPPLRESSCNQAWIAWKSTGCTMYIHS